MEELKLEEIAPYLPYGLEYIINITDLHPKAPEEKREMTLTKDSISLCLSWGKPLLYPLSMLADSKWLDVFVQSDIDDILEFNRVDKCLDRVEHYLVMMLYRNHFDVENLIGRGLAIDKTTIKELT